MKAKAFLLAFVSLHWAPTARAQKAKPPQPRLDDLVARAKAAGKPLLIDFYAVWCKPCKEFKKKILPKKAVQTALGSVVFQQYDAERDNGLAAAARYGVTGYPTFVVIDGSGKARTRHSGFMNENAFLSFVTQAQVDILDESGVKALLARRGNDPHTVLALARWHRAAGSWKKADRLYQRVVKLDAGNKKGLAGPAAWECLQLQRYHKARAWIVRTNTAYIRRFPSSPKALVAFGQIAIDLPAATRDGLARKLLASMAADASQLNSAVYAFLAAGSLDAALAAATRQVALAPKDANAYDTLAEVHHYRGEKSDAIAASKKALAMIGKKSQRPMFARNLARFERPGITPSSDVERAIHQARKFLADLPGHDPVAQKVDPVKRPPQSAQVQLFLTFRRGLNATYRKASSACAKLAGKLDEVYVRIEFADENTKRAKRVVVLEPGASPSLERCLVKNLKRAEYSERPAPYKKRYTGPLRFESASKGSTSVKPNTKKPQARR